MGNLDIIIAAIGEKDLMAGGNGALADEDGAGLGEPGEVVTRARTPPPHAHVPWMAQRLAATAERELKWPTRVRPQQPSTRRRPATPRRSANLNGVTGTLTLRGTGGKLLRSTPRGLRRAEIRIRSTPRRKAHDNARMVGREAVDRSGASGGIG